MMRTRRPLMLFDSPKIGDARWNYSSTGLVVLCWRTEYYIFPNSYRSSAVKQPMLLHSFPNLQWLKNQAESRFSNQTLWGGKKLTQSGWPTVILNVTSGETYRDNIPGPFSLFSTAKGKSFVSIDKKRITVSEDYFFLSNATQRYTLEIEKNQPSEVFNIHFGERWAEEVITGLSTNKSLLDQPDQSVTDIHFYNKLFHKDEVVKSIQNQLLICQPEGDLKQDELLFKLMCHLLKQQGFITQRSLLIPVIKSATREEILKRLFVATDFIYSYYHRSLSLEELAKISCLSKFHFLRLFKHIFQKTPHQFITEIRIEKARQLLQNPDIEIKQLARQLGFENASSFSRLFYNHLKIYPSQYKLSKQKRPFRSSV
jgi:AraC family transcriptional regulator